MAKRQDSTQLVVVTKRSVEDLVEQRELLKKYISNELKEAFFTPEAEKKGVFGVGDYGIIPGTVKKSLLKPGAEKLLRLFNLGVRIRMSERIFEIEENFASYTYRAEVYLIRSGLVVAECEGTVNSQEKKYATKTEWFTSEVNGRKIRQSRQVATPVADISNTMMKMAQKRAMVGATLIATGASEYFSQDVIDADDFRPSKSARDVTPEKQEPVSHEPTVKKPVCCGREMMISGYIDKKLGHRPWYCLGCKSKVSAEGSGAA